MNLPKNLTKEQIRISGSNQMKAWKAFGYSEKDHKGLVLHHKDVNLRSNDVERYILWLPEDLEVMTMSEHTSLHNQLRSEQGVSPWNKGLTKETDPRIMEYSNTRQGHEVTAETRAKIAAWNTGKKYSKETNMKKGAVGRGKT